MCRMEIDYEGGTIPAETVGDRLERSLKHAKVGVQEMAEHLGLSRNQTGRYINDRTPVPKAVLRVWALRCGVPYSWLVTGNAPEGSTTWRYTQLFGDGFFVAGGRSIGARPAAWSVAS